MQSHRLGMSIRVALTLLTLIAVARADDAAGHGTPAGATPGAGPATRPAFTNSIGMNFVRIAPGEFMMGSPPTEAGRETNETQHKVKITRGFMMAATTTTQAQWKAIMGTSVVQQRDKANAKWILSGEGDDLPIYYVTWDEAVAFCRKLSDKEGNRYRLPTEAQWEYACRAGTIGAYCGTGVLDDMGWFADNSGDQRIDSEAIFKASPADYDNRIFQNHCHAHSVAGKRPNAWGLYDMHGNVWQWCSDYFGEYPGGDAVDPTGPEKGEERVVRGGSWFIFPSECRCAFRDLFPPNHQPERRSIGFRVCLDY